MRKGTGEIVNHLAPTVPPHTIKNKKEYKKMQVKYYNRSTKYNTQFNNIKRVLTKWCKYTITALVIYASLYILCVAAGCPY